MIFSANLTIREFTLSDTAQYYLNNQDVQTRENMPNHAHANEAEACAEIESFIAGYSGAAAEGHWAVVMTGTDELIGHVGIGESEIDGLVNSYEICCAIRKDLRGRGYAAEAVRAFVPWCKQQFGMQNVYASASPDNVASVKALLNAGFIRLETKPTEGKPQLDAFVAR